MIWGCKNLYCKILMSIRVNLCKIFLSQWLLQSGNLQNKTRINNTIRVIFNKRFIRPRILNLNPKYFPPHQSYVRIPLEWFRNKSKRRLISHSSLLKGVSYFFKISVLLYHQSFWAGSWLWLMGFWGGRSYLPSIVLISFILPCYYLCRNFFQASHYCPE